MTHDKEIEVLSHIAQKSSVSQRELAKTTGLSLGMINIMLKKLVEAGYLQVSPLNKRKMQYLLTPRGSLETVRKQFRHATETIKNHQRLRSKVSSLLKELHASGYDYFSIQGDGELKELVESIFQESLEDAPVSLGTTHRSQSWAVVLNLTAEWMDQGFKGNVVNVLERLG
jgi:DNA-binding MarR family transcriptional regulator